MINIINYIKCMYNKKHEYFLLKNNIKWDNNNVSTVSLNYICKHCNKILTNKVKFDFKFPKDYKIINADSCK